MAWEMERFAPDENGEFDEWSAFSTGSLSAASRLQEEFPQLDHGPLLAHASQHHTKTIVFV